MRRVAIIGNGGAGKTTLALELGRRLGLPVVHLDRVYWRPGWVDPPRDEWYETHRAALAGDAWIADGNYGSTMEDRLAAADTIVFLDANPALCIWRVAARNLRMLGRTGEDLAPGCVEHFGCGRRWRSGGTWRATGARDGPACSTGSGATATGSASRCSARAATSGASSPP